MAPAPVIVRIASLSRGGAVLFLRAKRASSLMTMLPEVCELAQQAGLESATIAQTD